MSITTLLAAREHGVGSGTRQGEDADDQTVKIAPTTVAQIGNQTGRRKRHVHRKFK